MQTKREQILRYLRDHGRGTVEELALHVDLAPVTVRHHLNLLRESGLVESHSEAVGRGRPRHVYRLSPEGAEALCGRRPYELLLVNLVETLRDEDGIVPAKVFRSLAARIADRRAAELEGMPIEGRLDVLTELLGGEGFVVNWERDGDDFVISEIGCPYRALSETHDEVCQLDLELIRIVAGGAVSRDAWRGDGRATCAFRVRPASVEAADL